MSQAQTVQGATATGGLVPVRVDATGQVFIANPGSGGAAGNLATAAKGTTAAGSPTSTTASADRQPLDVTLRDTAGNAVAVGGGTQYVDGAVRGTPTGTVMMVDDGTNIQSAKGDAAGRLDVNVNGTVPVSGTFFQATQPVSLATAPTTPVTGAFFQTTQPVSGTVTVSNPTTNPETGLAKDGTDITTPTAMPAGGVGIRGWLSAIWTKLNGSLAVTGTFFQATQPVSGTVTANTGLTQPLTDTQLRTTAVPVSLATAPTTPVTGTFFQATQPVSTASLPLPTGASTETTLSALNTKVPAGLVVTTGRLQVELPAGGTGLTNTEIRATALPVSLASTAITGSVAVTGSLTDTQLRAAAVQVAGTRPNSGVSAVGGSSHLTVGGSDGTNLRPVLVDTTGRLSVIGTFFQATQPVSLPSLTSTVNSSSTALLANGVFTGTAEDVSQYSSVNVFVFASHASATDGLSMQFSPDGTNWDNTDVYTIPATTGKTFSIQVVARFFRVVYTNGATAQSAFRMQTIHHYVMQLGSSIRPQDGRGNDNDMQEELAHGMLYNGTTWDRARGDITNGQFVQVKAATNSLVTNMQTAAVAVGNGTNMNVQGYVSAIISITGTMGASTSVTFEASVDDTTFVSIAGHQIGLAGNLSPTTTNTGDFRFNVAAYKSIRARVSVFGTGSVTARGYASPIAGHPTTVNANIIAALPTGTNTIGNVGLTPQTTNGLTTFN